MTRSPRSEAELEQRFGGRFSEWSAIAEGAEGRLYRVRDRWSGRVRALKTSREHSDAILREYELLSRLRHPCLLESVDLVRDGDLLGHVLEYVPVVPPQEVWTRGKNAAVRAALVQALRGLQYLHRNGLVHSDVAPGNVLVWQDGERWRAKVADLGFALPVAEARHAGVRGSVDALSPETARGEGVTPASDLFGLAVCAVHWADGEGPWSGLSPGEALNAAAKLSRPLQPRRPLPPDLAEWVVGFGDPDPEKRSAAGGAWSVADSASWGPSVTESGIHGLEPTLEAWESEIGEPEPGRVLGVSIRGRVGSGRRTAAGLFSRRLVAKGWRALSDLPLDTVRDWLEDVSGDPDPVRLAREMTRRYADADVVLLWPGDLPELDARLYQAFLASREQTEGGRRTVVVRTVGVEGDGDGRLAWRELPWPGLDEAAVGAILSDLYGEEGGKAPAHEAGATPLALHVAKRSGRAVTGDVAEAVRAEVGRALEGAGPSGILAAGLIAWSEWGWTKEELAELLSEDAEGAAKFLKRLEELRILRPNYRGGFRRFRPADWLTREALSAVATERADREVGKRVCARLEEGGAPHGEDLSLATELVERGCFVERYADGAMEAALGSGNYEAVLRFKRAMVAEGETPSVRYWGYFLRAAQGFGRYPDEIEALEKLIDLDGDVEGARRKMLVLAYTGVRDWPAVRRVCEELAECTRVQNEVRLWAEIHIAEILWQQGNHQEAEEKYEEIEKRLTDDSDPELWLKYTVGRARWQATLSHTTNALDWLQKAESQVSRDALVSDPTYLLTKAGLVKISESAERALDWARQAEVASERSANWETLVHIKYRWGNILNSLGRFEDAGAAAREAGAIAAALGSSRMSALASAMRARQLTELGFPELSLGIGREILAANPEDNALRIDGESVVLRVVSYYGLRERTFDFALAQSDSTPYDRARKCWATGTRHLVQLEFSLALPMINEAVRIYGEFKSDTDLVETKLLLAEALMSTGREAEGRAVLAHAISLASERDLGKFELTGSILDHIWRVQPEIDWAFVSERLKRMALLKQRMRIAYWAWHLVSDPDVSVEVRRLIFDAIKVIAANISEKTLRGQFLGARRFAKTLEYLKRA